MKNPFKFGTIVEGTFFTDRTKELAAIRHTLDSENHLVLISPRRYGKSSLVAKAIKESGRPYVSFNFQNVIDVVDLASKILREVFRLYPFEKVKRQMSHFRIIPVVSVNPMTNGIDVSFQPATNESAILEDSMELLEKVSREGKKIIVVFDEFQEIKSVQKGLDRRMRAIMQEQQKINYILLGSQESMMTEIFERKKSPFYHFGQVMYLDRIPYVDFKDYILERLPLTKEKSEEIADGILSFSNLHPYYTQPLASKVWELITYDGVTDDVVRLAIDQIVDNHDLDYERLWLSRNRTDRLILRALSEGNIPVHGNRLPSSTVFSALKRLTDAGFIVRTKNYAIEDPFFERWVHRNGI
ncbi:MAG: ATP-binding protein [Muribaculaceae bacterium]|nr:ATP-binding protein [Muribaculaceae bacterium]